MKIHPSAPMVVGAGALLCALILAGCSRQSPPPPPDDSLSGAMVAAPSGEATPGSSDPLSAARSPHSAVAAAAQDQTARDVQDNGLARALAVHLAAHPDWLSRQQAICGPGNATLQARYAALKGPPTEDLRDLRIACLAKDIAERSGAAPRPGVVNTGSL